MDLLSVMNQRVTDQHSELRRSRLQTLAFLGGAATLALMAAVAAPVSLSAEARAIEGDSLWGTFRMTLFCVASFTSYVCMLRAANALATQRYMPVPVTCGSSGAGWFLGLPQNEQMSNKARSILVWGFYGSTALAALLGLSYAPYVLYGFVLGLQWGSFSTYLFMLNRFMNPCR